MSRLGLAWKDPDVALSTADSIVLKKFCRFRRSLKLAKDLPIVTMMAEQCVPTLNLGLEGPDDFSNPLRSDSTSQKDFLQMCTDKEFAAAQWLTTQIPALNSTTVRRGTVQDDWDVRDVWLDVPGIEPRSMGVRVRGTGCVSRDFAVRLAVRMKDKTYRKTEFFKLKDRSRQCCHLYLQRWELYNTDQHEYVLVDMRKMRDLGFFEEDKGHLWSGSYLTPNKDAYFIDLPLIHLIDAGCVLSCRAHNRLRIGGPDLDTHLHPDTPLKWYSVRSLPLLLEEPIELLLEGA